jgi:MoaA/NifB/PqqE/SkfB family radical SAM enzyme
LKNLILDGHKLNWHQARVQAWQQGEPIAPITIDCALTRRCNYRCAYCYGKLQANNEKIITRDVIYRFLDDAADIGVKAVSFVSDGESTCSPHLREAIVRGRDNGLDMALGTNGYLLSEEDLDVILPKLTYLRFNFSAGEPQRYAQIMGCSEKSFHVVKANIRKAVEIKKSRNLEVTIGLQMVLMPQFSDQILPLAKLGRELGVDYLVIKHCSDDEDGALGVDYQGYFELSDSLKRAESYSDGSYLVSVKWSKILSGGQRSYQRCFGPQFILQLSGSGLVAPCGMLFNSKYKRYHIGNIVETSFRRIWQGRRYREVMNTLCSDTFDARTMCGTLCLQHKVNEYLNNLYNRQQKAIPCDSPLPQHVNFI